jgi:murein DD-endopeptidase MepM/ murein hydrolase activator NlpD
MTNLKKHQLAFRLFTIALTAIMLMGILAPGFSSPAQAAPAALVCTATHTVKAGETLSSIANKYGVSVSALASANGLSTTATVHKGQRLCIPPSTKNEPAALNVQASKGMVTISGSGLTKSRPYLIKVKEGDLGIWYVLGRISSTKDGSLLAKNFTLPKELRYRTYLTVCLKNQISNQLTCKKVFHMPY